MATEQPKYPDIVVQLVDEDVNAWAVMGRVSAALRKAGVSDEKITEYLQESTSGDYDNLLATAMKWVVVR